MNSNIFKVSQVEWKWFDTNTMTREVCMSLLKIAEIRIQPHEYQFTLKVSSVSLIGLMCFTLTNLKFKNAKIHSLILMKLSTLSIGVVGIQRKT